MVNKPVLFVVDDLEILRAVELTRDKSCIFEPFFATKGVCESTGPGLDIVRRTIAGHGRSWW